MIDDPITAKSYYTKPDGSRIMVSSVYVDTEGTTQVRYFHPRNGRKEVKASTLYNLIEGGELTRIYP